MNENTPDLFTLTDEEGKEHLFELIDCIEEDNTRYYAMVPHYETAEESLQDDGELVILKASDLDENGMETLATIEDEEEFEKIGNIFLKRIEEAFGEEMDGCDCDDCCGHDHGHHDHGCGCGCEH